MNIKRIQFTPDATIRAAEAGDTITHMPMTCVVSQWPEADNAILVQYGMPAEYWDVVVQLLRVSKSVHGEAIAEGFVNALEEWAKI
jgi:hypothetical protein